MDSNSSLVKDCIECIRKVLCSQTFAKDCSTERELCDVLSDGEILCNMLTELTQGRVGFESALTYSANSHLLAKKNVKFFLKQCKEAFDLTEGELFEPDDLLSLSNPERVLRTILKLLRSGDSSSETEESSDSTKLMNNLVKEICNHEQALVDKMLKLMTYRSELRGLLSHWSEDLVNIVFKHTDTLYDIHVEFHTKLDELAKLGCEHFCKNLADAFSNMRPKLDIYCQYFAHLPSANTRMQAEFERAPELRAQLCLMERKLMGLSFRGLYDAPIRQATNYPQLFSRLLAAVKAEMPDAAESVQKAMKESEEFVHMANNFKRQAEQLAATNQLLDLIASLPEDLSKPEDIGLHQADECFRVRVVKSGQRQEIQHCLCILTTKQLMVAEKSSKRGCTATFSLSVPVSSSFEARKSDRSGCLEVLLDGGDNKVVLEDLKHRSQVVEKWVKLMTDIKAENFPGSWNAKSHSFKLVSLPTNCKCSECGKPITGIVMQGYSCAHCNKQLHLHCMQQLTKERGMDYYHQNVDRVTAEKLLDGRSVGTFLLRASTKGGKALSMKSGPAKVDHINIVELRDGKCALGNKAFWLDGLDGLIDYYRENNMIVHFKNINSTLGDGIVANQVQSVRL